MRIGLERLLSVVSLLAVVLLLGFAIRTLLLCQPCLGVADIYDFWRVMRPAGIEHLDGLEKPGHFVVCTFKTGPAHLASGPSSAAVAAWLAKHFGLGLVPGPGLMDLRQMGRLWLVVIMGIVVSGIAARVSPLLLCLWLYVLVDPGYLLFFNSFYADAAFFVALFGFLVWTAACGTLCQQAQELQVRRWWACAGALVCVLVLGGASKMQYVLFPGVALVCLGLPLLGSKNKPTFRAGALGVALAAVSVAAPLLFFVGPAPRFLEANNYHAVFGGIVKVSSNPEGVLKALAIPRRFWNMPQTDFWSAELGKSHPVHRHLRNLSRPRLLALYAADPRAVRKVMTAIEEDLTTVETDPRGHFVRATGERKKRTYATAWQFSRIHAAIYGLWPPVVWAMIGIGVLRGAIDLIRRRWSGTAAATLFIGVWVPSQLVVIVLGEGLINLKAHLVGIRFALDLLLILLVWDGALNAVGRWRRRAQPEIGG